MVVEPTNALPCSLPHRSPIMLIGFSFWPEPPRLPSTPSGCWAPWEGPSPTEGSCRVLVTACHLPQAQGSQWQSPFRGGGKDPAGGVAALARTGACHLVQCSSSHVSAKVPTADSGHAVGVFPGGRQVGCCRFPSAQHGLYLPVASLTPPLARSGLLSTLAGKEYYFHSQKQERRLKEVR